MIKILRIFLLTFTTSSVFLYANPCNNGISNIDHAYRYAKKAYISSNIEELHDYIKKTKSYAKDSQVNFRDCNCSKAVSDAENCYKFSRKAYNENNFEDAKNYAKKALRAAEDSGHEAKNCNQ